MEYEYNGKNGQATRMEMLIALDYLLNNCTSDKKTSKTTDLVEYAQVKYQTFIDRRRANGIFEDLVSISNTYPQLLPLLVKKVPNKPRYYVEKRLLDEQDVLRIANSIANNKTLSKQASNELLEKFLNVAFTDEQQKKNSKRIRKKARGVGNTASSQEMQLTDFLEDIRERVCRFHFSFARSVRRDNASGFFPIREQLAGYVYEVINDSDDITRVCLYLDEYKVAAVVRLEELIIDKTFEPVPRINRNPLKYELKGREPDIDKWLSNYLSGQSGFVSNIEFKFYIGHLEEVQKAYKKFFKREMQYEIKERIELIPSYDKEHPEYATELTVEDVYSEVTTSIRAFEKWYFDYGLFQYMVIINPAGLNDRLVGQLMERFARRLNRYGERYNIEIVKTIKPAYEEKLRIRHERIEAYRRNIEEKENGTK